MAVQRIKAGYIDTAGSTDGQVLSANSTKVGWRTLEGVNTSSTYAWTNNHSFSSNLTIGSAGELIITAGAGISANGGFGTAGQVLSSNGSSVYWGTSSGGGSFSSSTAYTWTGVQTFNANVTVNAILTGSIVPRVNSNTTITTLNWTSASFDQYQITALAANLTISADSGTPVNGQKILFRIKDNGTSRTITWTVGSSKAFRAMGLTLPTATVVSKILYVGAVYNDTDARWDVIATALET